MKRDNAQPCTLDCERCTRPVCSGAKALEASK